MTPQRKLYEYRLNNGLCPRCGNPKESNGFYCRECRKSKTEYDAQTKEFLLSIGMCPGCGKEKLYGDEKRYPECRAKDANRKLKEYWNDPVKIRRRQSDYHKRQYAERVKNGLCTRCGKRKPYPGMKMCGICREKSREQKRLNYKNKIPDRGAEGTCYRCGKPITTTGMKLCDGCIEVNRRNSVFYRGEREAEN